MLSRLLVPSLLLLSYTSLATAQGGPSQCISFDASWNLLAFNFDGKDYNAGTSLDSTTPAQDITTTSNRPPFDVTASPPLCFLSKFTNSVYVLNADAADKSAVYIYDASAKSWSKQLTTGSVPQSFADDQFGAILDHDTNVFYALSGKKMLGLDMALLKSATDGSIPWNEVGEPELSAEASREGYLPTMALAQNHIHFLGVPGLNEGEAKIFVIHFSYLQPEVQSYGSFPDTPGKTASFFKDTGVQTQFAFIPEDAANTYVVDVIANSTTRLPGPSTKDSKAMYAASPFALVQLASQGGAVQWIGYDQDARVGTSWKALTSLPKVTGSSSAGPGSGSGSGTNTGSNKPGSGGSTGNTTNSTSGENDDEGSAVNARSQVWLLFGAGMVGLTSLFGFAL